MKKFAVICCLLLFDVFQINLPTGGQVIIKPQGQFINVWMKGSPLDQENIEGKAV